ncbi:MAG: P22 coat protein - protein 5 domain protein, partial [Clostridiales bacterium]|nr:P22 coat protein - protein 5 domain protein [Clostridiales bacterium]
DKAQQTPKIMGAAMQDAAYRIADVADKYIASQYVSAGKQIGTDAAPITLTKDNIYDTIVDAGVALTEKNVPKEGRFLILPPWAYGLLLRDDRFVGTGGGGAESTLANGQVGKAAGFTIMESNNVPNTSNTKYKILGGHRTAWSFADQITETEAYRPERRFGDAVKGLHVYGAKVTRPDALVCLTANK